MKALRKLLGADIGDVAKALKAASFATWPQDDEDLLEFFMLMVDTRLAHLPSIWTEDTEDPDISYRSMDH